MNTRIVVWLAPLPLLACYSPHDDVSGGGDDAPGESSSEGSTDGSMSSTATTLTTSEASTSPSTTPGSTDPGSTEDTASGTADDSGSGSGGDPFCGDGAVDDEEECDAGEANAFEAECRPDCTFNTCGDGYVWDGVEGCDDGEDDNVLEVGACAPDCSRVIVEKVLKSYNWVTDGSLGNNPVAVADATCEAGYLAMFAVPGEREATQTPNAGDGQIDWVLQPYTAYVNEEDELVWLTDSVALLGIRDGVAQPLEHVADSQPWPGLRVLTGMATDWTALNMDTCNGWTSSSPAQSARYGDPTSLTEYLNSDETDCENWSYLVMPSWFEATGFYCVEQ